MQLWLFRYPQAPDCSCTAPCYCRSDDGRDDATATVPRNSSQSLLHLNHSASSLATADDATASSSGSGAGATETGGDLLTRKRAYKEKFQEGIALFNKKPKKGIALLQVGHKCVGFKM